jgi:hypothetical protein
MRFCWYFNDFIKGEILRPPENIVSQTMLFRYKDIEGLLCRKHRKIVLFRSKEYLSRSITFLRFFRTQFPPDFFVAKHYVSGFRPPDDASLMSSSLFT